MTFRQKLSAFAARLWFDLSGERRAIENSLAWYNGEIATLQERRDHYTARVLQAVRSRQKRSHYVKMLRFYTNELIIDEREVAQLRAKLARYSRPVSASKARSAA